MRNLIIPACGQSTRFAGVDRPKFLLTHPFGDPMICAAIRGLPLKDTKIYGVFLKSHLEKFNFDLRDYIDEYIVLDESKSQVDTVYQAIKKANINGSIIIKDCDNYFELSEEVFNSMGNSVGYYSLNKTKTINTTNKSYLKLDNKNHISSIVEKSVISDKFCCGLYAFKDAIDFCNTVEALPQNFEYYISDIIWYQIITNKSIFEAVETSNYEDWGTIEDWNNIKKQYKTLFIDLDGILVENGGMFCDPYCLDMGGLQSNIDYINKLYIEGKTQIIITTARPRYLQEDTLAQLQKLGIKCHAILMGLLHAKRVLVNDFAASNPYPSAEAINIPRNSDLILKESL